MTMTLLNFSSFSSLSSTHRVGSMLGGSVLGVLCLGSFVVSTETGCASNGGEEVATALQSNTADDLATARELVTLLNGPEGRCNGCHSVNGATIRAWGTTMADVEAECFA